MSDSVFNAELASQLRLWSDGGRRHHGIASRDLRRDVLLQLQQPQQLEEAQLNFLLFSAIYDCEMLFQYAALAQRTGTGLDAVRYWLTHSRFSRPRYRAAWVLQGYTPQIRNSVVDDLLEAAALDGTKAALLRSARQQQVLDFIANAGRSVDLSSEQRTDLLNCLS